MAVRIVQYGSGDPRPLVLLYHLNPRVDDALREAAGPNALIANDTVLGSDYSNTPALSETVRSLQQAAQVSRLSPILLGGFSAGGFATRRILAQGGDPDALVVADGTYATTPDGWADWQNYADRAKRRERVFVASHTSLIVPSSTWHVLSAITGVTLPLGADVANRPADVPVISGTGPARYENGNFIVYSYPTDDMAGHQFQGDHVLPTMIGEALSRIRSVSPSATVVAVVVLGIVVVGGLAYLLRGEIMPAIPRRAVAEASRRHLMDWWQGDLEHAVEDLWLYVDNTGELYPLKREVLADPSVYDARLAPFVWIGWVNLGAAMYVHEIILNKPLSTFYRSVPLADVVGHYIPRHIREELARQIAEHERARLIEERDYAPMPRAARRGIANEQSERVPVRAVATKLGMMKGYWKVIVVDDSDQEVEVVESGVQSKKLAVQWADEINRRGSYTTGISGFRYEQKLGQPLRHGAMEGEDSTLKLYVWKPSGGGVSWSWEDVPKELWVQQPHWIFGRCGSGWHPMRTIDDRMREKVAYCAKRTAEKFGMRVEVVWSAPPRLED